MTIRCDVLLFADAANFSEDGKLNLLGEFNLIKTTGPEALAKGRLVARIVGNTHDLGAHELILRIRSADGDLLSEIPPLILGLGASRVEAVPPRTWFIADMPPVRLPAPGTYTFELHLDGLRQELVGDIHVARIGAPAASGAPH